MKKERVNPWIWVPTLYFAEGLPYFMVNTISVIMFKKMGMDNGSMAWYTSLLYLPWVIKPFWSPFVDLVRTKRWWTVVMQILMSAVFFLVAFSLPGLSPEEIAAGSAPSLFSLTLILFWITAFASATHDIAADGFYMLALKEKEQSFFVGIRSTFYRLSSLFGQGVLVVIAGLIEKNTGDIPLSWRLTVIVAASILTVLSVYHVFLLPAPAADARREGTEVKNIFVSFGETFRTFFSKPLVWLTILFLLLYRLPEALVVKMVPAFLVDPVEKGGLGLSTVSYGLVNNTVGVVGIVLGGIIGGAYMSRVGLKRSLWIMGLSLALPCVVYLYMSLTQTQSIPLIASCVFIEQFGYGFGFTAYMLYMIFFAEGNYKTAHYSLCTAFMAASMMLPGAFAGYIETALGYSWFFVLVMITCLATVLAVALVRRKIPEDFGCSAK